MAFAWSAVPYYGLDCPWCSWHTSDGRRFLGVHCSSSRTRRCRFLPIQHEQGREVCRGLISSVRAAVFEHTVGEGKTAKSYAAAHAGGKLQSPIGRAAMTRAHNLHLFCRPVRRSEERRVGK